MSLMDNYAKASESIFVRLQRADNPYDINDGEVLLAITSSRNVLRPVEKGRKELGQSGTLFDAFEECIRTFRAANSDLIDARNVIEHADDYIVGAGRSHEDWFDIERHYDTGAFIFTIGKREIDLTSLAATTAALSVGSEALFEQWLTLEATLDYWRVFLTPLTDLGYTVRVPFTDFSDVTPFVSFDEQPRENFILALEIYRTRAEAEAVSGPALTVSARFDVVENT